MVETKTYGTQPEDLVDLLKAAALALEDEERTLHTAYMAGNIVYPGFHQRRNVNEGLAFRLYETSIMYVIYKAWLPRVPVAWDYERGAVRGAIDLVVLDTVDHDRALWAFEAKWWNRESDEKWLVADFDKLAAYEASRRLVLALWFDCRANRDFNEDWTARTCQLRKWNRVFSARFSCHVFGCDDGEFALDVIDCGVPPNIPQNATRKKTARKVARRKKASRGGAKRRGIG
jgi:hypothetical protein